MSDNCSQTNIDKEQKSEDSTKSSEEFDELFSFIAGRPIKTYLPGTMKERVIYLSDDD